LPQACLAEILAFLRPVWNCRHGKRICKEITKCLELPSAWPSVIECEDENSLRIIQTAFPKVCSLQSRSSFAIQFELDPPCFWQEIIPKLISVTLDGLAKDFESLLKKCTNLRRLTLNAVRPGNDWVFSLPSQLEFIRLEHLTGFDAEEVKQLVTSIGAHLPTLKGFDFHLLDFDQDSIDEILKTIYTVLPHLEFLRFPSGILIRSRRLNLTWKQLAHLETNCYDVSEDCLQRNFPLLTSLKIRGTSSAKYFLHPFPVDWSQLRELSMERLHFPSSWNQETCLRPKKCLIDGCANIEYALRGISPECLTLAFYSYSSLAEILLWPSVRSCTSLRITPSRIYKDKKWSQKEYDLLVSKFSGTFASFSCDLWRNEEYRSAKDLQFVLEGEEYA